MNKKPRISRWRRHEQTSDKLYANLTVIIGMVMAIFILSIVLSTSIDILELPTNVLILVMSGLTISIILMLGGEIYKQIIKLRIYDKTVSEI